MVEVAYVMNLLLKMMIFQRLRALLQADMDAIATQDQSEYTTNILSNTNDAVWT